MNETAPRRGECAGETCLCACARAFQSVRVTMSAHGGGREPEERGGICAGRQRQTIMNTKLRRYQRRAKGTGKRINEIGVQPRGRHKEMNCPHINTRLCVRERWTLKDTFLKNVALK